MVLPFQVALFSGVSVAALMAAGGDAYAVGGNSPEFVADFAGELNSGTEYYRSGGSDTTFSSVFTHSGLVLPATMTDSDGVLKWAPHNLISYSEQLDNAYWPKTTGSVTANSIAAPDGETTGDLFVPSASASSTHRIFKDFGSSFPQGEQMTSAVFVRAGGYEKFTLLLNDVNNQVKVDLGLGTITFEGSNISASSIQSYGDWYLVKITSNTIISHRYLGFYVLPDSATMNDNSLPSWTPNGTSGVYLWGAHVYRSDLGGMVNNTDRGDSYVPTTTAARYLPRRNHYLYNGSTYDKAGILIESAAATNLATYSNTFTNAAWSTNAANETLTAAASTGPDGATSMTRLNDDSGTGTGEVYVDQAVTVATSTAYTFSVYAKADQLSWIALGAENFTTPANGESFFNLSAGTVGTAATGHTARIENVASGIYRCSITFTTNSSDTSGNIRIYVADADTDITVDRDGTSSVYIYGAQFEAGSVPTSYIPVVAGSTVTRAAETLTVAGANLPYSATAMSFQQQGRMNFADTDSNPTVTFFDWRDTGAYLGQRIQTNAANTGLFVGYSLIELSFDVTDDYVPGINVSYNNASRHTSDLVQGAKQGSAHTADSDPTAVPNVSSGTLHFGTNFLSVTSPPFTVALFRAWGTDLGEAGIETAST